MGDNERSVAKHIITAVVAGLAIQLVLGIAGYYGVIIRLQEQQASYEEKANLKIMFLTEELKSESALNKQQEERIRQLENTYSVIEEKLSSINSNLNDIKADVKRANSRLDQFKSTVERTDRHFDRKGE